MKKYILRQEYFGGIVFNRENYKMDILNRKEFYNLISSVNPSLSLELEELLRKNWDFKFDDAGTVKFNEKKLIAKNDYGLNQKNFDLKKINRKLKYPKLIAPLGIYIEITNDCQYRCIYCYNGKLRKEDKKSLDKQSIIKLIKEVADMGGLWIRLTGGEPTLNPDWEEIVQFIIKKGMMPVIYTNGNYFNREEVLDRLVKYKWGEFRVTLAGDRETHNVLRKNLDSEHNYDEVISTIERLASQKVNLKVNYTLLKNNIDKLKPTIMKMADISKKTGHQVVLHIGPLRPFGSKEDAKDIAYLIPDAEDFLKTSKILTELNHNQEYNTHPIHVDCDFNLFDKPAKRESAPDMFNGDSCGVGKTAVAVNYFGEVQICGIIGSDFYIPGMLRMIENDKEVFGNLGINKDNIRNFSNVIGNKFSKVWFDSFQLKFFSKYKKTQCGSCGYYLKNCGGICPAMALYYSGDMRYGDKSCFKHLM